MDDAAVVDEFDRLREHGRVEGKPLDRLAKTSFEKPL